MISRRLHVWLFATLLVLPFCSSVKAERPNVLLLCIDDLRPELKSFGAEYIESPHIDALAAEGRAFTRHYVQAPTCGASRYALLTGAYGRTSVQRGNGALVARSRNMANAEPSFPELFRKAGYTTVSLGKVSHHPGGRFGKNWNDPDSIEMPGAWDRHSTPTGPWMHPEGVMHGLANGQIRKNPAEMDVLESFDGPDTAYPDGLTTNAALQEIDQFATSGEPFLLAVGIIRPHLPFGAPATYMSPYRDAKLPAIKHPEKPEGVSTWHRSGEFMRYHRWGKDPREDEKFADEVRKHYAAAVTYADACVGRILDRLEERGLADNTIVVLWGDHGWNLGEHSIWGKHCLFDVALRSPLIIRAPMIVQSGVPSRSVVETVDVFPTLCDLCDLTKPPHLDGQSLASVLRDANAPGKPAVSYWRENDSVRTDSYRLIRHFKNRKVVAVELYDHTVDADEGNNIADSNLEVVSQLSDVLNQRFAASTNP